MRRYAPFFVVIAAIFTLAACNEPCRGMWNGGPTDQDCARAMIEGFEDYADQA